MNVHCKRESGTEPCDAPFCDCMPAWSECIEMLRGADWGPLSPQAVRVRRELEGLQERLTDEMLAIGQKLGEVRQNLANLEHECMLRAHTLLDE
ncbi:MAG: hypothetical protein HRJ53_04650 [Acidobacteria bacterium Pan2503]|uniref:Uncharacterized protein n=1 Tax=Candidatus Acidiferrum panamense TaxID=2741543 RepID=A0A7V8NNE2_9BACT|nr:hypothetical protein [Candidatus Acidoferrum panamensis]